MTFSTLLAIGTVLLQIATVLFLVDIAVYKFAKITTPSMKWIKKNGPSIVFLLLMGAVIGSLVYSEAIGFPPCSLCWWQRIFVYPAAIISGLGLIMKDRVYAPKYTIVLLYGAGIIASYHSYIQYGGSTLGNCGVGAVSCAERMVWELGYVTLPLMGLSVVIASVLILLVSYKK